MVLRGTDRGHLTATPDAWLCTTRQEHATKKTTKKIKTMMQNLHRLLLCSTTTPQAQVRLQTRRLRLPAPLQRRLPRFPFRAIETALQRLTKMAKTRVVE